MAFLLLVNDDPVGKKGQPGNDVSPWGMTRDGRVIFAPADLPPPEIGSKYSQYDKNNNVRRRVRFESYLASLVLLDSSAVMPSIRRLNAAIGDYLEERQMTAIRGDKVLEGKFQDLGGQLSGWLYPSKLEVGRLGMEEDAPPSEDVFKEMLLAAERGTLQEIMNVHATIIGNLVNVLGYRNTTESDLDEGNLAKLKPASLFSPENRGRTYRTREGKDNPGPSTRAVGIMHEDDIKLAQETGSPELALLLEEHTRAINVYKRNVAPEAMEKFSRMGAESPFVASYSGSSVDFFRLASLFGHFDQEGFRQYALAVAAFLIGGGHHSFHEVMSVGRLAGLKYRDGDYDSMIPNSFKATAWYDQLIEGFPDILYAEYCADIGINFPRRG